MAETFTLYKLIVLYMLDRVDFPLTTSQISEFILDKGYTTYFRLQSALAELTDSGLLKIELTHNRTLYNLTEEGAATINYFRNKISPEIRQEIDNFINEKKYDLKEEVSVKSDYYLNTNLVAKIADEFLIFLHRDRCTLDNECSHFRSPVHEKITNITIILVA